jgi:hypothetical protein
VARKVRASEIVMRVTAAAYAWACRSAGSSVESPRRARIAERAHLLGLVDPLRGLEPKLVDRRRSNLPVVVPRLSEEGCDPALEVRGLVVHGHLSSRPPRRLHVVPLENEWGVRELRRAIAVLAASAPEQIDYLEWLGTLPSLDELVLELHDVEPILPKLVRHGIISIEAERAVGELTAAIAEATASGARIWDDQTITLPEWERFRSLARAALAVLPGNRD